MHTRSRQSLLLAVLVVLTGLLATALGGIAIAQTPVRNASLVAYKAKPKARFPHSRKRRALRAPRGGLGQAVAVHTSHQHSPNLLFDGSKIEDFPINQSAPGAVSEVPDPAGSGESVFKMTVSNEDVAPITPTENPRAQLLSPSIIHPGDEFWWHARFYLPKDFPSSVPSWVTVMEGPYGPPWDGTPPWSIDVQHEELRWQRNDTYDWDVPWHMPLVRGQWVDVLLHDRFGTNGFVEMWIDGEQVTFFADSPHNPNNEAPTQRLNMATMDHTNNGAANFVVIQSYRKVGMFNSLSLYQGPTELGTTRESVGG